MNGEIYYVVGKPAHLKHEFFNQLWQVSRDDSSLKIPRLYTTNPELQEVDNIQYIDKCDFELRDTIGIYCLTWAKAGYHYGVCGEGVQWAQNGHTVVINGSLLNLDQAMKSFPEINVVLLRLDTQDELPSSNSVMEVGDARIDWVDSVNGLYCPYVLT